MFWRKKEKETTGICNTCKHVVERISLQEVSRVIPNSFAPIKEYYCKEHRKSYDLVREVPIYSTRGEGGVHIRGFGNACYIEGWKFYYYRLDFERGDIQMYARIPAKPMTKAQEAPNATS